MAKGYRRWLSILLSAVLVTGLMPAPALAEAVDELTDGEVVEQVLDESSDEEGTSQSLDKVEGKQSPAAESEGIDDDAADQSGAHAEQHGSAELSKDARSSVVSDTNDGEGEVAPPVQQDNQEGTLDNNDGFNSEDLIEGYIEQQFEAALQDDDLTVAEQSIAADNLDGYERAVYDLLKPQIAAVAAGEEGHTSTQFTINTQTVYGKTEWSAAELGVSYIWNNSGWNTLATGAFDEAYGIEMSAVVNALLADCPYELYWFDKTSGYTWTGYGGQYVNGTQCIYFPDNTITLTMAVATGYSDDTTTTINNKTYRIGVKTDTGNTISNAVKNAQSIANHATGTAYDQLSYFKDQICNAVSYNSTAAGGGAAYGDPWQLVYVFDNDTNTNVVCEGYSKAFKYLCDLKNIDNVECILATGVAFGGDHMWNIVNMDNGKNYLVDVTNCDGDPTTGSVMVGYPDYLFLKVPYQGNATQGYTFDCGQGHTASYEYDNETFSTFTTEELTLATTAYEAPSTAIDIADAEVSGIDETYIYRGTALTPEPVVTYNGTTLTKDTDYTLAYSGNNAAGTGTITITGTGSYTGTKTVDFTILGIIDEGTWGTCPWELTSDGTLTVHPGTGGQSCVVDFGTSCFGYWFNDVDNITSVVFAEDTEGNKVVAPASLRGLLGFLYNVTSVDLSGLDTSAVEDMSLMFYGLGAIQTIDASALDTSSVTNMSYMFNSCSLLESIDYTGWDTSSVTNMSNMFSECYELSELDLSGFNTSSVTDMSGMLSQDENLASVNTTGWDTSEVTTMEGMFEQSLSIDGLDLSHWNTSSVTNMSHMFYNCVHLNDVYVNGWNTSSVENMNGMFFDCFHLPTNTPQPFVYLTLDLSDWDTSSVTDMGEMFGGSTHLGTIYVGNKWTTQNVTTSADMFASCPNLVGGNNTAYDANHTDAEYARIDTTDHPGYLTSIATGVDYEQESNRAMLPGWKDNINRWYDMTVYTLNDPDGYRDSYEVTGVSTSDSDVVSIIQRFENDDKSSDNFWWEYQAVDMGEATLTVEYLDYYGEEASYTFTVTVGDETYGVDLWSLGNTAREGNDGSTMGLPGETIVLQASGVRYLYEQEDDRDGFTYTWEVIGDGASITNTTDNADGTSTAEVTFSSDNQDEWFSNGVWVRVTATKDGNSGSNEIWLNLENEYPEIWIDETGTTQIDTDMAVGDTQDVTPQVRYFDSHREQGDPAYELATLSSLVWGYDENCVSITNSQGVEAGSGTAVTPGTYTITRLGDWDTDINLQAVWTPTEGQTPQHADDHGHRYENASWHLDRNECRIWFDNEDETDNLFVVDANSTTSYALNSENLGDSLLIDWKVGLCVEDDWVDDEVFTEGTEYTVDTDTNTITLNGKTIYDNHLYGYGFDDGWNNLHVRIFAQAKLQDTTLDNPVVANATKWVDVRQVEESYDFEQDRDLLPGWDGSVDEHMHVFVRNGDYPDGEDFDVDVTDVEVVEGEELLSEFHNDSDDDGYWWYYRAGDTSGVVTLRVSYIDIHGNEKTYDFNLTIANDSYRVDIYEEGDTWALPGEGLSFMAEGWHDFVNEDGDNDATYEGLAYQWRLESGDDNQTADKVQLEVDEDKDCNVTVTFPDVDDDDFIDGDYRVRLVVDLYDGETNVATNSIWVECHQEYLTIEPYEGDFPRDMRIGETYEFTLRQLVRKMVHEEGGEWVKQVLDITEEDDEAEDRLTQGLVTFDISYDSSVVRIDVKDHEPEILRSSGDEGHITFDGLRDLTVTRLTGDDCNIEVDTSWRWAGQDYGEDDYERDHRTWRLDRYDYDLWFEEGANPDKVWVSPADDGWTGSVTLTAETDLDCFDEDGDLRDGFSIDWTIGDYWGDGEGEGWHHDYTSQSETDGLTATIDTGAIRTNYEDGDSVNAWVTISYDGDELARAEWYFEIETPTYEYDLPEQDNMLPGWETWIGLSLDCFVNDPDHNHEHVNLTVTGVEVLSETPAEGVTDVISDVETRYAEGSETFLGWSYQALGHGTAVVKITYTDLDGQTKTHQYTVTVSGDVFQVAVRPVASDTALPGKSVTVWADGMHFFEDADEPSGSGQSTEGLTYAWNTEELEAIGGVESAVVDQNDPARLTVTFAATPEHGAMLYFLEVWPEVTMSYGGAEVAQNNMRIACISDYDEIWPATIDPYLAVNDPITVTPQVRRYCANFLEAQEPYEYEVYSDATFDWDVDPDEVEIESNGDGTYEIVRLTHRPITIVLNVRWTDSDDNDVEASVRYDLGWVDPLLYTVTFVNDDGTELTSAQYEFRTPADEIEVPEDPTKAATAEYTYTFAGWDAEIADVTENATYTATYTATKRSYLITFKDWDNEVISSGTYEYGTAAADITPAAPTREADDEYTYEFAGWSPEVADVTGEATYTATYTPTKIVCNEIVAHPQDATAAVGERFTLTVEATGDVSAYSWQNSRNGSTWSNVTWAGHDTDTLSYKMSEGLNGRMFRCVVTFADGTSETSESATVTLPAASRITGQPAGAITAVGERFTLSVVATDATAYSWQNSRNGNTWTDVTWTGHDADTLSYKMSEGLNGRMFRCVVTFADGTTEISEVAVVTLPAASRITGQPASASVAEGGSFTLSVTADGATAYSWQHSRNGSSWSDVAWAGHDGATLTHKMSASLDGRMFRCVVSFADGTTETSEAATVTLAEPATSRITGQPASATVGEGGSFTLSVTAEGAESYSWQHSRTGASWSDVTWAGHDGATLTNKMSASLDGRKFRCVVTFSDGTTETSEVATITLATAV